MFIGFPIMGALVIIVVLLSYFSTNRINLFENKLLISLMVLNVVGLSLELGCYYSVWDIDKFTLIKTIILKGYVGYIIFFNLLLNSYILILTNRKYMNSKLNIVKYFKKTLIEFLPITIVLLITLFVTPLEIFNDGISFYTHGTVIDLLFIASGFMLLLWLIKCVIAIIKNKGKNDKKYYVILSSVLLMGLAGTITQFVDQRVLILTAMHSLVLLIIYFTIENPDLKMIDKLDLAKMQADKANQAKSDFLSSMSHEIRTPLNVIVGLSSVASDNENIPDDLKEDLSDIQNASQVLLEIVGNIIDINKIEANKIDIINDEYSIEDEVKKVIKLNEFRIGDKDLEVRLNLAVDLPYKLIGDKKEVRTVMTNLISNSIKYTEKGYVSVDVKTINKDDNCLLIISVQDTGKGIKDKDKERLFKRFERAEEDKNTTIEGTGLGLAITKNIVELMGGTINFKSNYGSGTLFIVQIPQKIAVMNKPKDVVDSVKKEVKSIIKATKKLLIVDDNPLNIKVMKRMLVDFNFDIEESLSGVDCLELIKSGKSYDLILMDIMMPKMGGEEVMGKLRELPNFNTPVVAVTADAVKGSEEKYIESGFTDYVAKPFNKDQIKVIIDKLNL